MNIKLFLNIKTIDKYGNILDEQEKEANSLVNAFIALMQAQLMAGFSTTISVKDTSNTSRSIYNAAPYINAFTAYSGAGVLTQGIVVGSGTNAVAVSDYNLQTLIAHGVGSGQLEYSAMEVPQTFIISGSDAYFTMRRTVINSSGNDVTFNEVGLIVDTVNGYAYKFLIDRTLSTQVIGNGLGKVITYKWQISI